MKTHPGMHPNSLAALREYGAKKGECRNPGGTIRGTPKIRTALLKLLRQAVNAPFKVKTRSDRVAVELYKIAILDADSRARLTAIRDIMDRLYGKPAQEVAITSDQRTHIVVELGLATTDSGCENAPAGFLGSAIGIVREDDDSASDIEALDGDRSAVALLAE